ncbi:MAG: sigma-70 family RNA polymerase sigma factor [Gemmataceae bacterium]|nr:sigma-70 family RNA polymerase sigma factor [Gemmataceae bacterium]
MDHLPAPKVRSLTQGLLQYRGMLYGFIYSLVRDVVIAEEVFQEVALIAMEKERKGDEVIREPAKWLKEVVRRIVHAGYRARNGRMVPVDPNYLEQVVQTFAEEASVDQQQDRLSALGNCLEHVSEANRDLLRRRYVAGASYDEIGRDLRRTPGALRVLVHRVQRQLADCVEHRLAAEG